MEVDDLRNEAMAGVNSRFAAVTEEVASNAVALYLRRGFPGTRGEGNKAAALEATEEEILQILTFQART